MAERREQEAKSRASTVSSMQRNVITLRSAKHFSPISTYGPRFGTESGFSNTEAWNIDSDGTTVGTGIVGFPNSYVGAAAQGTQVTFTQDIVANGTTSQPLHLLWVQACGDPSDPRFTYQYSSQIYDLGQIVTPPLQQAGVAGPTFSITLGLPALQTLESQCPVYQPHGSWFFTMWLAWVPAGASTANPNLAGIGAGTIVTLPVPTADENGCGCSGNSAGFPQSFSLRADPVNTATGAFSESFTDATVPGPAVALSLARSYTSSDTVAGPLGVGWRLPWLMSLSFDASGNATFTDQGGRTFVYTKNSDGSFAPPALARSTLVHKADGSYALTTLEHQTLTFDGNGILTSQKAVSGQGLAFAYSGGQLATVTDAAGHTATMTYAGSLLTKVTFSDGRYVGYGYTGNQLTSVTDLDGQTTTYGYESGGRLKTITDPLRHTQVTNTYDSQGRVTKQVDATNDTTLFSYSGDETDTTQPDGGIWSDFHVGNVLTSTIDPLGNRTTYSYDSMGNPTGSLDPMGNVTSATFTATGQLATATDALQKSTLYTYDANGNVASATDADSNKTAFTFTGNLPTQVTDALSQSSKVVYTSTDQVQSVTSPRGGQVLFAYNPDGSLQSSKDPDGNVTSYTYDAYGNVASVTDPRGNAPGANPAAYTTHYTYDNAGRVLTKTDPLGNKTQYQYDTAGRLTLQIDPTQAKTQYTYDDAGRLTQVTDPDSRSTTYGYDGLGRLTSVTDALQNKTTYTFDADGNRASMTTPLGNVAGANKAAYTTTYGYDADNHLTSTHDPLGFKTSTQYDADGRVISQTDQLNNQTQTSYDAAGNVQQVISPSNAVTSYGYDADSQLTSVTSPAGKTTYGYDQDGNRTLVKTPLGESTTYSYDAAGQLTASVDPRGNVSGANPATYTTIYGYDPAGNQTLVTDPLGSKTQTAYDADNEITSVTDPTNNTTGYQYDGDGRVTQVTDPLQLATVYHYDPAGYLTSRVDANLHTTGYTVNEIGQLTKVTDPLGRFTQYGYDANGDQTSVTDAAGVITTRGFDALGRVTSLSYSDGTHAVTNVYDGAGNLHQVTDATGTRTLGYDALGDLTSVTQPGSSTGFAYVYNTLGEITSRTNPDGESTGYQYDADQRVTAATADGATTGYGYDVAGNLTSITLPSTNGYIETRGYDAAGRLTSVGDATSSATPTSGHLTNWQLTLDAAGRPSIVENVQASNIAGYPSPLWKYSYDADGRMASSCQGSTGTRGGCLSSAVTSYGYDNVGNLLSQTSSTASTTYSYDAADELSTATSGSAVTSYGYDQDGRQTTAGANTFAYDATGHLKTAKIGATSYNYTYDAQGDRITASTGSTLTRSTQWDINNPLPQVATDRTGTGTLIADYHYNPLQQIQSENTSAGAFYYAHDALGSITDLTSATGATQETYTYSPFGQATATAVASSPPANPFTFTGAYSDSTTPAIGDDLRARNYDPTLGRFTTPDPIALRPNTAYTSSYAYAQDAPTYQVDPSGLDAWLSGGGNQHDIALAMAAVQLEARYGVGNVYADLDPHPATSCGSGRIDLGTPVGQAKAYPDLLVCGSGTYVWEVKPANLAAAAEGAGQIVRDLNLLADAGRIARPGPEINPETVYVPQFGGTGYWLSMFSAEDWATYADPSQRAPLMSTTSGLIFYASKSSTQPTPLPLPLYQPVKVAKPGDLPGFASFTSCPQLNSKLVAAGLFGLGLSASGLIDWAVAGRFAVGVGRWIWGLIELEVSEQA